MQGRIAAIVACGIAGLILIGTAGAVSDSYYEKVALGETELVSCSDDRLDREDATDGSPNCSVHRVSTTYARQAMATTLTRDRTRDD